MALESETEGGVAWFLHSSLVLGSHPSRSLKAHLLFGFCEIQFFPANPPPLLMQAEAESLARNPESLGEDIFPSLSLSYVANFISPQRFSPHG